MQTTASPPRFLLSDHIFSTAASLSSYALPPPFAQLGADVDKKASGEGQATEEVKGVEGDDVLLLGQMKGVEKLMKRVCDVQGESCSTNIPPCLREGGKSPVASDSPHPFSLIAA